MKNQFPHLVNNWLERIPYLKTDEFDFWKEYQISVEKMFKKDEEIIKTNLTLNDEQKKGQLINLNKTKETFLNFFLTQSKSTTSLFSAKSRRSALFILLYRQRPLFIRPFQFLQSLIDLDEKLTGGKELLRSSQEGCSEQKLVQEAALDTNT